MLRGREGKKTVKEVDEKGRGIRERNVDSSRDGRREDKIDGNWAEEKQSGMYKYGMTATICLWAV
jgi:hypothetical protein